MDEVANFPTQLQYQIISPAPSKDPTLVRLELQRYSRNGNTTSRQEMYGLIRTGTLLSTLGEIHSRIIYNITMQRQKRNHSLADDMMSENDDHMTNKLSPESYSKSTKCGSNRDRPKEMDTSAPDGAGGLE